MAAPKGHKQWGHIRKGQKTAKTILREDARKYFEAEAMKKWAGITLAQLKRALKDQKTAEYVLNQVIGKPKETVEHQGINFTFDLGDEKH